MEIMSTREIIVDNLVKQYFPFQAHDLERRMAERHHLARGAGVRRPRDGNVHLCDDQPARPHHEEVVI